MNPLVNEIIVISAPTTFAVDAIVLSPVGDSAYKLDFKGIQIPPRPFTADPTQLTDEDRLAMAFQALFDSYCGSLPSNWRYSLNVSHDVFIGRTSAFVGYKGHKDSYGKEIATSIKTIALQKSNYSLIPFLDKFDIVALIVDYDKMRRH